MVGILAGLGALLCRVLAAFGLDGFAPAVCFGGDTTALGYYTIILSIIAVIVISEVGYRVTKSSAVIMVVISLTVVAAGSAAIIEYFE